MLQYIILSSSHSLLENKLKTGFGKKTADVIGDRLMLYGDFMDIGADDRKYVEITDNDEVFFWFFTPTKQL